MVVCLMSNLIVELKFKENKTLSTPSANFVLVSSIFKLLDLLVYDVLVQQSKASSSKFSVTAFRAIGYGNLSSLACDVTWTVI